MTFFVREAKPRQQVGDGRMVHLYALGIRQRVAQFKERDVGILRKRCADPTFLTAV